MARTLKDWLKRLILRGTLLDWWVARRARQWERSYVNQLVEAAAQPLPTSNPSFKTSAPLRRMVFIADCMWEQNDLVPELQSIAEVVLLDLRPELRANDGRMPLSEVVSRTVGEFVKGQGRIEPDLVFFYARPALLSSAVFDSLRGAWKCPLFGMNLDDKIQFFHYGIFSSSDDNYEAWARKFDLNLTNCLPAMDWYRERGLPCLYAPQGVHRTADLQEPTSAKFKYEFTFLGSNKPERKAIVEQLLTAGVPIQLFGSGWPNTQWVDSPNAVYRGSQMNLGIGFASPSTTLTTVKGRDFECPGVGACYVTSYNWELPQFYELGKEILCYRSLEELVEMYSWYRQRPEECLKIAQAAWRRCTNEHTWEKRFRKVFSEAGFRLNAE